MYARHLLERGAYEQILRQYPDQTIEYGLALLATGREARLPDTATFRFSRLDLHQLLTVRAMRAHVAGRTHRADSLLAARPVVYNAIGEFPLAFSELLVGPLLRAFDGEPEALTHAWQSFSPQRRYSYKQQLWHQAAYLAGAIEDSAFLAQPYRLFANDHLLLLRALRDDIAGCAAAAIAGYRAFRQLDTPPIELAADCLRNCPAIMELVAMRRRALGDMETP
jgi:hypothetical protein